MQPDAYLPTYGWLRGWPASFRRHALLAAAIFVILALSASLWRSRRAPLAIIAVSVAAAALWMIREKSQSPLLQMSGRVLVRHETLTQIDRWTWYSTLRSAPAICVDDGLTKPIFASRQQAASSAVTLHWNPGANSGVYEFQLEPRHGTRVSPRGQSICRSALRRFNPRDRR